MTTTWSDIMKLVEEHAPEGPHLDFKREPYAHAAERRPDRKDANTELRRDATSFANAGHGRIIIGIDEQDESAFAIRHIADPIACEKQVSNVLASNIEPPFSSSECRVFSVLDPLDASRGVVVIDLSSAATSTPRAVAEDNVVDFWIRAGKSKRRMAYFEIMSAFRRVIDADAAQATNGIVRHEVRKLRWHIGREVSCQDEQRWVRLWPMVRELADYAKEYGFEVRQEVLLAIGEVLDFPRRGMPEEVAVFAVEVVHEAVGDAALVWARKPHESPPDTIALAERALNVTWSLLWDSTRYLKNSRILYETLQLWSRILRWSRVMDLKEMEQRIIGDLRRVRAIAAECRYPSGVRLVDWSLLQSEQTGIGSVDLPFDLYQEVHGK